MGGNTLSKVKLEPSPPCSLIPPPGAIERESYRQHSCRRAPSQLRKKSEEKEKEEGPRRRRKRRAGREEGPSAGAGRRCHLVALLPPPPAV
eukprot:3173094-Rhodomonas_salina.2